VFLAVSVPAIVLAQGKYCGSKKSDVYHYPSCRYVAQILPENLIWFKDEYEAVANGYRPCKVCNPPYPQITTTITTKTTTYTSIATTTITPRTSTTPYSTIVTTTTSYQSPTITTATTETPTYTPIATTFEHLTTTAVTVSPTQLSPTSLSSSTPLTVESKTTSPTSSATTSHVPTVPFLDYTTLGVGIILGIIASLVALGASRKRVRTRNNHEKDPVAGRR